MTAAKEITKDLMFTKKVWLVVAAVVLCPCAMSSLQK